MDFPQSTISRVVNKMTILATLALSNLHFVTNFVEHF